MKTKVLLPTVAVAILAIALVLGGVTPGIMAVKHKQTSTFDNVKKVIIKSGADTFTINVNSVPGPKGDKGDKGDQGIAGVNGTNGQSGPAGPQGEPGKNGVNGTSIVIICDQNNTNPLCGNPTPPPPPINNTNSTGNGTR